MKESIEKRIEAIKVSEELEDLKKHVCPFYKLGDHPDCVTCRQTISDVEECRDYYLDRIGLLPMDIWSPEFDKFLVQDRDTIAAEEVVGIGINCNSCYMSDKCPMFKKGFTCGIKWDKDRPETPMAFMDFMINTQYERVKRASVFEKIDGGMPDANLSGEIDRLNGMVLSKMDMGRERLSINVEATGAAKESGGGGGILAKLFGGGGGSLPEKKTSELPEKAEGLKSAGDYAEFEEVKEPVKVKRKIKE